jgi:hypothetical protein
VRAARLQRLVERVFKPQPRTFNCHCCATERQASERLIHFVSFDDRRTTIRPEVFLLVFEVYFSGNRRFIFAGKVCVMRRLIAADRRLID